MFQKKHRRQISSILFGNRIQHKIIPIQHKKKLQQNILIDFLFKIRNDLKYSLISFFRSKHIHLLKK